MSDYGHPITFGSFITPANADPEHTVGLAVLAEQVGLDLVTFQDHPYQPAFLDTWTLLSFVAARTSRARLAANVTNLPLRPPAVLGRSVASLDLLSGGRVELGLGAGAFWDAIEAMGGRRLSPADAVRALEEAIEILRQIWDVGSRGGVRVDGQVHRVHGAKRGPAPAHPVEIWLGAYKPRMLALTGRLGDGWLPSLGYLQPGDLAAGNAIIDEAAEQAGRSPDQIRRLLNINGQFTSATGAPLRGPADQWAHELAELALQDGISVFILATDDPEDLRRFAGDVAPAVRELVAAGRAALATTESSADPETRPGIEPEPELGTEAGRGPARIVVAGSDSEQLASPPEVRGAFTVAPTPDDGRRRSATRVWDEADRPAGPGPDPGRTYTAAELTNGQQLVDIHNALRGELARIDDLIDQVAAGTRDIGAARSEINTMTMRQNNWTLGTYCESYCRIVTTHHTIEDQAMFPMLARSDPRLEPVIGRLQQEHRTIHDVLEGVDRALVALVSQPDGMDELRASVDLLADSLLSHLAYEERELVEPLTRVGLY